MNDKVESFVNKRKPWNKPLQRCFPSDPLRSKLQKIYARSRKYATFVRNRKNRQEQKRAKEKEINSVDDVGNEATRWHENHLALRGLARGAGLTPLRSRSPPRRSFLQTQYYEIRGLNTYVALIKLNGKIRILIPALHLLHSVCCPVGNECGGVKLDKDGGTWVTTTLPESSASQLYARLILNLTQKGRWR